MRYFDHTGHYELTSLPGCSAVVVSTHAFIKPEYRGVGNGKLQHQERLGVAKASGYGLIICTVRAENEREIHILTTNGWRKYESFINQETGAELELWGRVL